MNWTTFLSWWKKKRRKISPDNRLDRRLVKSARRNFFPRPAQLKYTRHFLSDFEKRLLYAGAALCLVGLAGAGTVFLSRHITLAPKEGGEYSEALIGQPKYINPLFASGNDVDIDLVSLIYAGLFHYAKAQTLEPYLAESYTLSDDKKMYTVTLRADAKWPDGRAVTADDVLYTFESIQNPEVGSPLYATFQGVQVEKMDERTVRFALKEPFAPFLASLTVGILPVHVWGDIAGANMRLAKSNLQPVGAGAWQFSKLLKGGTGKIETYTLTKNPHFFGDKPYIKTLTFRFYNETAEAVEALRSQTVSALNFVPPSVKNKLNSKNLTAYHVVLPQLTALFFNQGSDSPLKDDAVRLALAQAVDKEKIIADGLGGGGEIVSGPILPTSPDYAMAATPGFDVAAGNAALDKSWTRVEPEAYFKRRHDELFQTYQADFDVFREANSSTPERIDERTRQIEAEIAAAVRRGMSPNQSFYRQNKDGKILELTITTVNTAEYAKVAELVAEMWQDIGVKTAVVTVDSRQIVHDVLKNRSYDILLYGEIVGRDSDPFPFWHSSQINYPGLNVAQFADRNADKTLEDARSAADPAKRTEAYKKFQEIIAKEIPAVFLFSPAHIFMATSDIRGIDLHHLESPSGRFADISRWYVKTRWQWGSQ